MELQILKLFQKILINIRIYDLLNHYVKTFFIRWRKKESFFFQWKLRIILQALWWSPLPLFWLLFWDHNHYRFHPLDVFLPHHHHWEETEISKLNSFLFILFQCSYQMVISNVNNFTKYSPTEQGLSRGERLLKFRFLQCLEILKAYRIILANTSAKYLS